MKHDTAQILLDGAFKRGGTLTVLDLGLTGSLEFEPLKCKSEYLIPFVNLKVHIRPV